MTATPLTRHFRLGITLLPDPDPSLSPEAALKLYEAAYPLVAGASLGAPEIDGDRIIYGVVRRTVQTKGIDYVTSGAGLLTFDEGGTRTPLLKAIFSHYGLADDDGDDPEQAYVASSSGDGPSVGAVFASLRKWARGAGVAAGSPRSALVRAIATHLGAACSDEAAAALGYAGAHDADDYPIEDAVRLAMLLDDGHRLSGIDYQASHSASRSVHDAFGGYALRIGRHVDFAIDTSAISDCVDEIEGALSRGDPAAAADAAAAHVNLLLDAVATPHRSAVASVLAARLVARASALVGATATTP